MTTKHVTERRRKLAELAKADVTERRRKLAELAKADALIRCDFCRRPLPVGHRVVLIGLETTRRYCDDYCHQSATERAAFQRPQ